VNDFSILVVDDDADIREALQTILAGNGYDVTTVASAQDALTTLKAQDYPLILSDIMMPGMDGIELLTQIKAINSETVVVLMTGYSSVEGAIKAIKLGAQDYLIKPINYDEIILMLERNYQQYLKNKHTAMLQQEVSRNKTACIVGNSAGIKQVKAEIKQVAPADISVLVTGESGTGKELVARAIHDLSSRHDNMFVAINCASIPADLLESELFGHERGAFSGAITRKYGLFELADKGTILLDEIGDMPIGLQAKILRTLESGTFRRLGGTKELNSDFRVIASTHRDLQQAIATKTFRADLYFRLNQFHIMVPPLRKRKSDISLLVDHFATQKMFKDNISLQMQSVIDLLLKYHWPGNVRELFNALERVFLLAGGKIPRPQDLPVEISSLLPQNNSDEGVHKSLADIEHEYILKVYHDLAGNKIQTAETLGISIRSLYSKLKN